MVGYHLGERVAGTAGWGVLAVLLAIVITAMDTTSIESTPTVTRRALARVRAIPSVGASLASPGGSRALSRAP
jgi:hypothetical protein